MDRQFPRNVMQCDATWLPPFFIKLFKYIILKTIMKCQFINLCYDFLDSILSVKGNFSIPNRKVINSALSALAVLHIKLIEMMSN
jgi:hypothetical protein